MPNIDRKQAAGFFVAGAIVGAFVALIYAPQSGARTTKDIRKFARKTVDRIDDLQDNIRYQVGDWIDDMTVVVKDGGDRGKRLGVAGYTQVVQAFDKAKQYVEDGKSRFEEMVKNT
jgi:gas vesicle protein